MEVDKLRIKIQRHELNTALRVLGVEPEAIARAAAQVDAGFESLPKGESCMAVNVGNRVLDVERPRVGFL